MLPTQSAMDAISSYSVDQKREWLRERILAFGLATDAALNQARDYQVEMAFEMTAWGRFLNLDIMGLGKTLETILALQASGSFNTLITAREKTLKVWILELGKWWPECEFSLLEGSPSKRQRIFKTYQSSSRSPKALGVTLDLVGKLPEKHFYSMVVDECHRVKGRKSSRFSSMKSVVTEKTFLLTGSATAHTGADLWSYLHIADPKSFPSFWRFVNEYFATAEGEWGQLEVLGVKDPARFRSMLRRYALRREKDVAGLPAKQLIPVRVDPTPTQKLLYSDLLSDKMAEFQGKAVTAANAVARDLRLRQLLVCPQSLGWDTLSAGIAAGVETAIEALDSGQSVCIFTPFREAVTQIAEALIKYPEASSALPVYTMMGGMKAGTDPVEKFQQTGGVLISTIGLAESWTATKASVGIFVGYDWSANANTQAEDRLHRVGQERGVTIYYIINNGTIDERILEVLDGKTTWARIVTEAASPERGEVVS